MTRLSILSLASALLFGAGAVHAQNVLTRAGVDAGPVVITGATVHAIAQPARANARIRFEDGRITAIGGDDVSLDGARVVDATGKHVYPGFIVASSVTGLVEIGAVRATVDTAEVGAVNPNVRAEVAVNPDSELIPVTRAGGVLTAHVHPIAGQQGVVTGTSAVLALDGWTVEDMLVRAPVAMHVEWPSLLLPEFLPPAMIDATRKAQEEKRTALERAIADARAYAAARAGGQVRQPDLRWEAMLPVLERKLPMHVHANDIEAIEDALDFAARHDVDIVIVGGIEAWRVAPLLKARDIPVIVGGTHVLPLRRGDPYDAVYRNPARLAEAGVRYAIAGQGDVFTSPNERNLPFHAASAVAHGLPYDEALKAITLYPAQLLGVADRLGSLEPGKDATLFIADGDALEMGTVIEAAWIGGRAVDLANRHRALYEKYRDKYAQPARR